MRIFILALVILASCERSHSPPVNWAKVEPKPAAPLLPDLSIGRSRLASWLVQMKSLRRMADQDERRIQTAYLAKEIKQAYSEPQERVLKNAFLDVYSALESSAIWSDFKGLDEAIDAAEAHLIALR